jgi:hypothetical protein
LKDFTYIFSTGDHIDNYELSGNVMLAETGKVDSTLIVMLHRKLDDSAVTKENPRYVQSSMAREISGLNFFRPALLLFMR